MGRPKERNSRRSRQERRRKASEAAGNLSRRTEPNQRVLDRRALFSFLETSGGMIDQDIHDGIGQLRALGLLDGHGHDSKTLCDTGRLWGDHYASLLTGVGGARVASYERTDKGRTVVRETGFDRRWDAMNEALGEFERDVLITLLVDPIVGSWHEGFETARWAQALIDEELIRRRRIPTRRMADGSRCPISLPDLNDRELLKVAIRGLCQLVDASLPSRWERAA